MWDRLDKVGQLAAIIVAAIGAYRFLVPRSVHAKNHSRLVSFVNWGRAVTWVPVFQAAIHATERILGKLYGPPRLDAGDTARRFLTVRAWTASAWIALFYLLCLTPIAIAAVRLLTWSEGDGDVGFLISLPIVALIFSTIMGAGIYFAARKTVDSGKVWSSRRMLEAFIKGCANTAGSLLAILCAILLLYSTVYFFVPEGPTNTTLTTITLSAGLIALVAAFAWYLFNCIVEFRFFAIFIVPVQILIVMLILFDVVVGIFIPFALLHPSADKKALSELLDVHIIVIVLQFCALAFAIIFIATSTKWFRPPRISLLFFILFIATTVSQLVAEITMGGKLVSVLDSYSGLTEGLMSPLIMFYGLILASSIPDWISAAFTRNILNRAGRAVNMFEMLLEGGKIIFVALLGILMTFVILSMASSLGFLLVWIGVQGGLDISKLEFYRGGASAFFFLFDLLSVGPEAAVTGFQDHMSGTDFQTGLVFVLAAAVFGCAALLPAVISIITVAVGVTFRVAAITAAPLLRYASLLFVAPGDSGASAEKEAQDRSAGIFGLVLGILIILFLALLG